MVSWPFQKIHSQEETGLPNAPAFLGKLINSLYYTISPLTCGAEWWLQFSCTSDVLGLPLNLNNQVVTKDRGQI